MSPTLIYFGGYFMCKHYEFEDWESNTNLWSALFTKIYIIITHANLQI